MTRWLTVWCFAALTWCAAGQPVFAGAADCSFEPDVMFWPYPSGGLVFEPGNRLRVREEHLVISDSVDVEYVLANEADRETGSSVPPRISRCLPAST